MNERSKAHAIELFMAEQTRAIHILTVWWGNRPPITMREVDKGLCPASPFISGTTRTRPPKGASHHKGHNRR